MELMWLDNKPVLHIVDLETGFQNAVFIRTESETNLWNYFYWTEKQASRQLNSEKKLMI